MVLSGSSNDLGGIIPAKAGIQVLKNKVDYSRHPWRSHYAPPAAFTFAILQTQSGLRRNDEQKRLLQISFLY